MKILHLTNKPIFPLVDGGCKAMAQTMNAINKNGNEVKHICLSTHKHPYKKTAYPKLLASQVKVENINLKTKINFIKAGWNLLLNISYNYIRFYSKKADEIITDHLKHNKYDVVIFDSLYVCPYLDVITKSSKAKIIYRAHNVEHRIWKRLSLETNNIIKRFYLNILSAQLKKVENDILSKVDRIWSISPIDADYFKKYNESVSVLPLSFEVSSLKVDYGKDGLFFMGAYNWKPNLDAVVWLANILLPRLHEKDPSVVLNIAGSYSEKLMSRIKYKSNVVLHGFVEDSSVFMAENGLFVMPITTGSGVRVKAIEAMSLGVPIIASRMAVEGIDHDLKMITAESIEDWVEMIFNYRNDKKKREDMGKYLKSYIKEHFDYKKIENNIHQELLLSET